MGPCLKHARSSLQVTCSEMKNSIKRLFSNEAPCKPRVLEVSDLTSLTSSAAQGHCTSFQNVAHCAIAKCPSAPAAGVGTALICTTFPFAQNAKAKPVGGRGISAFSAAFFFTPEFHAAAWSGDVGGQPPLSALRHAAMGQYRPFHLSNKLEEFQIPVRSLVVRRKNAPRLCVVSNLRAVHGNHD